ncbi:hypothetical protein AB205_0146810, partial [Aquarana catesbeiana]
KTQDKNTNYRITLKLERPGKKGEQRTPQPQDVEGGELNDVVEIVTTTGDVHVVEEQAPHFTSASAQILIQEIMVCSRYLDIIKQKTNEVEQKQKTEEHD